MDGSTTNHDNGDTHTMNDTTDTQAASGAILIRESATLTLSCPITIGATEVTEITLRRPKAGDLRGVRLFELLQSDVDALAKVTARISTPMISEQAVYTMDPFDLTDLAGAMAGFFVRTGATPTT